MQIRASFRFVLATLILSGLAPVCAEQVLFVSNFKSGIDPRLMVQAPKPDSISVDSHGGLKVSISKNDDYSRVANGVPRAELNFGRACRFQQGHLYEINWSTMAPDDFQLDSQQPEGISQIHGGANQGVPPFGLSIAGNQYRVDLRNGNAVRHIDFPGVSADKGRWVTWRFRYYPDPQGTNAISELYKDGRMVADGNGSPNAYPGDDNAYFKMGIYKWWWQERPSDVSERVFYFGDVSIRELDRR